MIKVILFDLDGTLLPMDQERFAGAYVKGLTLAAESAGYSPMILSTAIVAGTAAMVKNNGEKTNEEVFWEIFYSVYGMNAEKDMPIFDEFYRENFDDVKCSCGYDPLAANTVAGVKAMGYRVALATNPVFPFVATERRIKWAGIDPCEFELITTYENSRYCKPNLKYYEDIVRSLGVSPEECLMVGNDVDEDLITESLGMKVFLVTKSLINKKNKDISVYPHGDLNDLIEFIKQI